MNEKIKVETNEIAVVENNPLPVQHRLLDPKHLAHHVFSFGHGKNKVVGLDAAIIRQIGGILGISIEECEVTENKNGFVGKAKATTADGRCYFGFTTQPFKLPNGKVDPHAFQKCATKCQRNAILGLTPVTLVDSILDFADGNTDSMLENPLAKAKDKARKSMSNAKRKLQERGLSPQDLFDEASIRYGDPADWTLSHWQDFEFDIRNHRNCDWIGELAQQKTEEM